jgi:GGDEF domain-containing protein
MLSEAPHPAHVSNRQEVALTCYLSAMLAMARSMRAVCSRVGLIYGDRLMRLPRRLGFDATPEALEGSSEVLEADLAEYTQATATWLDAGSQLARDIVASIEALDAGAANEDPYLHTAMLEDLAEHMAVSAEVDSPPELRAALRRYALGLRSYLQQRRVEGQSSLKDLQFRADQLAAWLTRADPANCTDLATGLPNRAEIERQLQASWNTPKPVSTLIFEWTEVHPAAAAPAIAKQLADRLADLVRPRDIVGRWTPAQFAAIFECTALEAAPRAGSIAELLTGGYSVVVDGAVATIDTRVTVSVIERLPEETLAQLVHRIELLTSREPVADGRV